MGKLAQLHRLVTSVDLVPLPLSHSVSRTVYGTSLWSHGSGQSGEALWRSTSVAVHLRGRINALVAMGEA